MNSQKSTIDDLAIAQSITGDQDNKIKTWALWYDILSYLR